MWIAGVSLKKGACRNACLAMKCGASGCRPARERIEYETQRDKVCNEADADIKKKRSSGRFFFVAPSRIELLFKV